jgi:hypothetical protein
MAPTATDRMKRSCHEEPDLEFLPLGCLPLGGPGWWGLLGSGYRPRCRHRGTRPSITRHSVHLFDVIGTVYFGSLLVLLAAIHPGDISTWGRYAQAVAHGSLTAIVFGFILIGKPFTEPYAREQAPERVWRTTRFHELNRRLSAVWGLAFLVGTISLIIAGSQDSRQFILRLVVPFGALLLALLYTQKQTSLARGEVPEVPAD